MRTYGKQQYCEAGVTYSHEAESAAKLWKPFWYIRRHDSGQCKFKHCHVHMNDEKIGVIYTYHEASFLKLLNHWNGGCWSYRPIECN